MGSTLNMNVSYNLWIFFILLKHVARNLRLFLSRTKKINSPIQFQKIIGINKFYDYLDQWWHQAGSVMKHASATTMDSTNGNAENNCDDINQYISHNI